MRSSCFLIAILFVSSFASAVDHWSVGTGNWATGGIWNTGTAPAAGDNVTISNGNTITMNANPGACNNLTLNGTGTLTWTQARTLNVGGNLVINGTGSIGPGAVTGTLNVAGTMSVPAGVSATIGRVTCAVTGATTIDGTVAFNSISGVKTFTGNVTISSTGIWNATAAESFILNGSFQNDGTFTANTGTYTFGGAGKTFSGTSTSIFDATSIGGSYTNNGTVQVNTSFAGAGALTQGVSSTLIIGDLTPANILTATAAGNTVRYLVGAGNQSVLAVNYTNLIFDNLGTGTTNATGTYTVSGTCDALNGITNFGSVTVTGNLTVANTATLSIGGVSPVINGNTIVNGTVSITSITGTKTFSSIQINSGGTWTSSVNEAVTVNGNLTSAGTFVSGSGAYAVSGNCSITAGTADFEGTIAGTLSVSSGATMNASTGNCRVTGATTINGSLNFSTITGAKVFGDVTVSSTGTWNSAVVENFTINGNLANSGTFTSNTGTYTLAGFANTISGILSIDRITDLGAYTNNGTLSVPTALAGAGSLTQGASSILNIGGISSITTLNASTNTPNLVNYNGAAAQTIKATPTTYYNLQVSKTGGSTGTFGGNTIVNNDFTVTSGIASLGAFNLTVSGMTSITGTFTVTSITGTKTFNNVTMNTGGLWNGTAAETFTINGNVTMAGGTINATTAGIFNVAGTMTSTAATTSSIGIAVINMTGGTTVNGTLQITSATGTKTFNDLTIASTGTWNSTVAVPFTINGNLSNSGTFTANTGIYTLAGAGKTISGTISIPNTTVTGSYTNNGIFSSTTSLIGAGTFAQGITGTLNVGITSANFTVTTFNASASGNTVNYNLAGVQNVRVPSDGSYHHLTLSGSGIKTLLGTTDINGNLTISSALTASNFNITLAGNWSSTGSAFVPGTNTTTLDGAAQTISRTGGETFNHLTVAGSGTKSLGSDITTNGNLTISSTLDVTASDYAVAVKGNWTNNGTFVQNTGTVTFSGAAAQTIGGTTTTNFNNITQSNAAGVSLTQNQNLIDALTISVGTFTTTGFNFTLKSTSSKTARIATIPAGANFAGNIIIERYTGTGPTDWRFLCSAVSGRTLADWYDDFFMSGFTGVLDPTNTADFISVYSYDETQLGDLDTFGYVPATNVTNPIVNGRGYWVYLGPTPVTFAVTGTPYTFSQSPTITYTNSGNINNDGWNLIANPYPSAIDWDNASWTKSNLDNAIYIYNSYTGSFASYVGGLGVNGGSPYIASQQAFWVKANAAGPGITAVEAVKTASVNPTYQYLKNVNSANTSHYPMAFSDFPIPQNTNNTPNSIKLTGSNMSGKEDETFVRFMQGATNDFDPSYDAWKMFNLDTTLPNISSVIHDSSDLSINSLPELISNTDIKIRFTVSVSGTYSIRRDSILMLPMSSCIFLEDLANGNMIDLRTNSSYSFTISDTTSTPRFILHINAPVSKETVNAGCTNDSSGIAIATGTGTGPWNYLWTNSNGDTLQVTPNSTTSDSLFNLPPGIYTVEVSPSACGTVSDTIEIKSSSTLAFTMTFSDASCNGLSDGSAFAYVIDGISPYTYQWSNGETSAMANNLSAGTYTITVIETGGCSQMQTVTISQPAMLTAGFMASADTVDISINNSASFTNTSTGATSYYWDFGDGSPADTAPNPIHFYSLSGTYLTMLVAYSGVCSDTTYKMMEVINSLSTGIAGISSSSSVNVLYENGEVFLAFDLPQATDITISVYSMLGEKIFSQNVFHIQKNRSKLPLSTISSGIYVAVASMADAIISKKILITGR
ncbi:MAG: T9SS type A sorting domain-containing protein [Bacteroidetes bacterium]|nr:T9SS type A sorting domain-containing protein [Bacteroidota bacterium]